MIASFAAWANSPAGTAALMACVLVVGMILGYLTGKRAGWRAAELELAERRALRAQARWLERVRGEWDGTRGGTVMPYFQGIRPAYGTSVDPPRLEVAHEWEPAHVGQALALTRDDPAPYAYPPWSLLEADPATFEEEIQAMIANANANPSVRWLDQLEGGQP